MRLHQIGLRTGHDDTLEADVSLTVCGRPGLPAPAALRFPGFAISMAAEDDNSPGNTDAREYNKDGR
jgi:hypothetical protein